MVCKLRASARLALCLFLGATAASAQLAFHPAWTVDSGQDYSDFGQSVASAGDVNGDGYDDAIVGAPDFSNGQVQEGRVSVYLGSAAGLATTAAWTVESNVGFSNFGGSVAGVGDVNGDGYDDVVIGAETWFQTQGFSGRAALYLGSAAGLAATPAAAVQGSQNSSDFGRSVAGAGDVNGDGYDDVIIGASNMDGISGRAFLFHGSAAGMSSVPSAELLSPQAGAGFGYCVAGAGDMNGDGFDDVAVSAPAFKLGEVYVGAVLIHLGSATGVVTTAAWSATGSVANSSFGNSVAGAGDIDADGYDDLIVAAPQHDEGLVGEGRVFLYRGGPSGPLAAAPWSASGGNINAQLGTAVAGAGDVNADGFDDVVVGAANYRESPATYVVGRVFVFYGGAAGMQATPAWYGDTTTTRPFLGGSVAGDFDVNADGYPDVIAGAVYDELQYAQAFYGGPFASAAPYGLTKGGLSSGPRLRSLAPPVIGGVGTLDFAEGQVGKTPFLIMGLQPAALPFDGATLNVVPFSITYLPPINVTKKFSLPLAIPALPTLQGVQVFFQSGYLSLDAPGPHHSFLTNGLRWTLGM